MTIQCQPTLPLAQLLRFDRPVAILAPAFNEADHLADLVARCCAVSPALVVLVDDGSTDATPSILTALEGQHGDTRVVALRSPVNGGKQAAVRRGLRWLRDQPVDGVALIDGDGQHDPAELPSLVTCLDRFDAVVGVRSRREMPVQRRLSNWYVNTAFRLLSGVDFGDVQSGLRIFRKPLADALAERLRAEGGFGLEHESLAILAAWSAETGAAVRFGAAPVSCAYGSSRSHIGPSDIARLAVASVRQAGRLRRALAPSARRAA